VRNFNRISESPAAPIGNFMLYKRFETDYLLAKSGHLINIHYGFSKDQMKREVADAESAISTMAYYT